VVGDNKKCNIIIKNVFHEEEENESVIENKE
jgi:hypothetical protein